MSNDTFVTVTRTINAPAAEIFSLLTNPDRHGDFDASGMIRSAEKPQRLSQVGDVFRMNMHAEAMGGDYQSDNHVTGLVENRLVAWQTAPADTEPPGWEWKYELESTDADTTQVSLTYDWSKVEDKNLLKRVKFPAIPADVLEGSLAELAAAVEG